jgi:isoleucyl-tRNA synthetase
MVTPDVRPWVEQFMADIVEEVNVKGVDLVDSLDEFRVLKASPNRKALGPIFRQQVQAVAEQIDQLTPDQANALASGEPVSATVDGQEIELKAEWADFSEVDREGFILAEEGSVGIALCVALTDELVREGLARDIIRRLQVLRRDAGLELTDRIRLQVEGDELLVSVCQEHAETIMAETLAVSLDVGIDGGADTTEVSINKRTLNVSLTKA